MRGRLTALAGACASVTAVLLAGCTAGGGGEENNRGFEDCVEHPNTCNEGDRSPGGELIWTLDQAPDGYFPWSPEGGSVYTAQATHGILPYFGQHRPDGEYEFNLDVLAGDPELVSEDPFQVKFRIRPEAQWDDGTPISADDAILTWKMSTSAAEGHCVGCRPRSSAAWDAIDSVVGEDDGRTVVITWKAGNNAPEWFAWGGSQNIIGGIAPAHVGINGGFIAGGPDDWEPEGLGAYFEFLNDNPPTFSGGPWLIEEFDLDTQVVKVPNPNWYGAEPVTLDRLVIRFLTEVDAWVPALQNEELHGASPAGFGEDIVVQLRGMDGVRVHVQPGPSWEHLDLNLDNRWLRDHPALRQAIFTVVDQLDLLERLFGRVFPDATTRTNHVHPARSPYHVDHLAGTGQGSGDVELARRLLAGAGFEGYDGGPGSLRYQGETVGPFRLRSTTAPARVTAQQLIQGYLAEIGIRADLEPTDDLGGMLNAQDYDLAQFGWSGTPLFTNTGAQFWRTGSGSNFGNYTNADVDRLIDLELQATSLDESAALHNEMMEIVVADAYVLPLYDSPVYLFVSEDYTNVRDNTSTSLRALYQHHMWGLAVQ